jgi:hypothetical protein
MINVFNHKKWGSRARRTHRHVGGARQPSLADQDGGKRPTGGGWWWERLIYVIETFIGFPLPLSLRWLKWETDNWAKKDGSTTQPSQNGLIGLVWPGVIIGKYFILQTSGVCPCSWQHFWRFTSRAGVANSECCRTLAKSLLSHLDTVITPMHHCVVGGRYM